MQAAAAWIMHWNGTRNLYFSVNQPDKPLTTKATKNQIVQMAALHLDIDPPPPAPGVSPEEHYEKTQAEILDRLGKFKPQPTVVIFSGGGYQAFWKFLEPIEVADHGADVLEAYNKKLIADLGGDRSSFNLDRIMRLPFTMNLPTAKKREKGRVAVLSGVVEADWELLYSLSDFKPLKEKKEKAAKGAESGVKKEPPDWCRRLIDHGLDKEGKYHFDGDRSKAVWAVCCELVRCGRTDEEIAEIILDEKNSISEHVRAQAQPGKYAFRQAKRARETVGSSFDIGYRGKHPYIIQSVRNVLLAFDKMGVTLSYDEFKQRSMIEGPEHAPLRPIDDAAINDVFAHMGLAWGFDITKEKLWTVVDYAARKNPYHPVRQYLDGLLWDGVRRLDTWLIDHAQADDTPFIRAVSAIFLMAAVRRVRQPGVKFDEMLVLVSPQGNEKSSLLAMLATQREWFTDELVLSGKNREMVEILSGKWIVEAAELTGIRQVEHVKAVLSRSTDRARKAYAREVGDYPRQCVIAGTTNSEGFLSDPTGNRRFWIVRVRTIDLVKLQGVVDQIWAEAAAREAAGESIRLPKELWEAAEIEQERHTLDEPWLDAIADALAPYEMAKIKPAMLFRIVDVPVDRQTGNMGNVMAKIMSQLGWKRTQRRMDGAITRFYYKGEDADLRIMPTITVVRNRDTGDIEVSAVDAYHTHDDSYAPL